MSIKYVVSCTVVAFSLLIVSAFASVSNATEHKSSSPCASKMKTPCVCSSKEASTMQLHSMHEKVMHAMQKKDMVAVKQHAKEIENAIASMKDSEAQKPLLPAHKAAKELAAAKTEKDAHKAYAELEKAFSNVCVSCYCGAHKKAM